MILGMDNPPRLQPGAEVRCPHCRRWHPVFVGHTEGTDYTLAMLYFMCRGARFYAGQIGHVSRHPTSPPIAPQGALRHRNQELLSGAPIR